MGGFYNEHPDKPDRWHHTQPDAASQLMMDVDTYESEANIAALSEVINATLAHCTELQRTVWRCRSGVLEDGSVRQPMSEADVARYLGKVKEQIRAAYLEADNRVLRALAHPSFQAGRARTGQAMANLLLAINHDAPKPIADPGREDATVADQRIVEPTRVRNFETHGCTLPCEDGLPTRSATGDELREYQERMLSRSAS